RTRRRPSTALYSSTMSPLTSHTKLSFSIQSRISLALSFVSVTPALNPATPAATTDVSTTPLRRRFGGFGDNRQPRLGSLFPIGSDRLDHLFFRNAVEITSSFY